MHAQRCFGLEAVGDQQYVACRTCSFTIMATWRHRFGRSPYSITVTCVSAKRLFQSGCGCCCRNLCDKQQPADPTGAAGSQTFESSPEDSFKSGLGQLVSSGQRGVGPGGRSRHAPRRGDHLIRRRSPRWRCPITSWTADMPPAQVSQADTGPPRGPVITLGNIIDAMSVRASAKPVC